jgi:hypothetical protein
MNISFYFSPSIYFFNLISLYWLYLEFDLVVCYSCLDMSILQYRGKVSVLS